MEQFQKISSKIVIALALLWLVLVSLGKLNLGQSYLMLGALSAYIGVQNIILLNWGQRTGQLPKKIAYLVEQRGMQKGVRQYVLVNILLFLLIGIVVAYCGVTML